MARVQTFRTSTISLDLTQIQTILGHKCCVSYTVIGVESSNISRTETGVID